MPRRTPAQRATPPATSSPSPTSFNRADAHVVGTDQGDCIRVVAGKSYECNWTTSLADGQITVEGPFLDAGDSTLAITGGTGRYRKAHGFMKLHSLEAVAQTVKMKLGVWPGV